MNMPPVASACTRLRRTWLAAMALAALSACSSVPPARVNADRMQYGQVLADSWKRQTLLNVVRMRYLDAPQFLDVASIINSYTLGGGVNAQVAPGSGNPDGSWLGGTATWSNTPTVTYQPLTGDRFTKALLQPVPPAAVFQLLQGGWPVDLVFRTTVGAINELRNTSDGDAAGARFDELGERLSRLQAAGDVGLRVETRKDVSTTTVVLRNTPTGSARDADRRGVLQLLRLDDDVREFDVVYGLVPAGPKEVAILSRSMMEIMLLLGDGIELPPVHASRGWAHPARRPGDARASPLVRVRSGAEAPANAYAAAPYMDHWYWIDQDDVASKRTFTFLLILFSLAETGQTAGTPVVTVPSR